MEAGVLSVIPILVALEVILSADNALILGVLVQKLPHHLRRKALFYGILGAYVLRGLALLFAALVIQLWWVQVLGAAYLRPELAVGLDKEAFSLLVLAVLLLGSLWALRKPAAQPS